MFVVMGATGHVGSAVAETLLAGEEAVTILTRHPERAAPWREKGAVVAFADADDPNSMRLALQEASRAFLLNPPADPKTDTDRTERRTVANILGALSDTSLEKVVAEGHLGRKTKKGFHDYA